LKRIKVFIRVALMTTLSWGLSSSSVGADSNQRWITTALTPPPLHVPRGSAVKIDGQIDTNEWDKTAAIAITVRNEWKAQVRLKHDDEFLYFLFESVKHGDERLFPEILIDPQNRKGDRWEKGQWWFHVSANLCEGNGEPNVYMKNGTFQCAHIKDGWVGNNPPATDTTNIEIKVAFTKLNMQPTPGVRFGLATALTNATGDAKQKWFFWPGRGRIDSPATWEVAVLD
jgi:hypothetical protein